MITRFCGVKKWQIWGDPPCQANLVLGFGKKVKHFLLRAAPPTTENGLYDKVEGAEDERRWGGMPGQGMLGQARPVVGVVANWFGGWPPSLVGRQTTPIQHTKTPTDHRKTWSQSEYKSNTCTFQCERDCWGIMIGVKIWSWHFLYWFGLAWQKRHWRLSCHYFKLL